MTYKIKENQVTGRECYQSASVAKKRNALAFESYPLLILLILVAFQGYLKFFGIVNVEFIQFRALTWGTFACFFIWMIIFFGNPKKTGQHIIVLLIPAFVLLFIGAILGILNQNPLVFNNTKALFRLLSGIIIAYYGVSNINSIKMMLNWFSYFLVPLCLMFVFIRLWKLSVFTTDFHLGFYVLAFNFLALIHLMKLISATNKRKRDLALFFLFILGTIVSMQKAIILVAAVSVFFVLFFSYFTKHISNSKINRVVLRVVACFIILLIIKPSFIDYARYRLILQVAKLGSTEERGITFTDAYYIRQHRPIDYSSGRFSIWSKGFKSFWDEPLLGKGTGYYVTTSVGLRQLHNIYLYFIVSYGLFGICILTVMGFRFIKIIRKAFLITEHIDIVIPLTAFTIGTAVYGMFGIFFQHHGFLTIFSICFGMLLRMGCWKYRRD